MRARRRAAAGGRREARKTVSPRQPSNRLLDSSILSRAAPSSPSARPPHPPTSPDPTSVSHQRTNTHTHPCTHSSPLNTSAQSRTRPRLSRRPNPLHHSSVSLCSTVTSLASESQWVGGGRVEGLPFFLACAVTPLWLRWNFGIRYRFERLRAVPLSSPSSRIFMLLRFIFSPQRLMLLTA